MAKNVKVTEASLSVAHSLGFQAGQMEDSIVAQIRTWGGKYCPPALVEAIRVGRVAYRLNPKANAPSDKLVAEAQRILKLKGFKADAEDNDKRRSHAQEQMITAAKVWLSRLLKSHGLEHPGKGAGNSNRTGKTGGSQKQVVPAKQIEGSKPADKTAPVAQRPDGSKPDNSKLIPSAALVTPAVTTTEEFMMFFDQLAARAVTSTKKNAKVCQVGKAKLYAEAARKFAKALADIKAMPEI